MGKTIETLAAYQAVQEMEEDYNEGDGNGCLLIAVPAIGLFLLYCVLEKFGLTGGMQWTIIKGFFFPSTWDYQLNFTSTHMERAMILILTLVLHFSVTWALLTFIGKIRSYFYKRSNFFISSIYVLITGIYYALTYYFVINMVVMVFRTGYHLVAAFFVWLW